MVDVHQTQQKAIYKDMSSRSICRKSSFRRPSDHSHLFLNTSG